MASSGSSYYYDFNIIYNKANSPMSNTHDTELSLRFTECVVKKLGGWGWEKSYYHERDALPGRNVFKELLRVIRDSKYTIVIISPGFVNDCWAIYSQQTAFKKLLTKDGSTRLLPLVLGNVRMPEDLDVQNALYFTEDNYDREGIQWEKLKKVLKDDIPISAVNTEEEERRRKAQATEDNLGRTERQGTYVTQPVSTDGEVHMKVLQRCYDRLVNSMDPEKVLDSLEGKDVLDHKTIRDIRDEKITSTKNRKITDLMISLSKRKYEKFKETLHECYHDDEILVHMWQEEENLNYQAPTTDEGLSMDGSQAGEGMDEPDRGPVNGENLPGSTSQQIAGVQTATDVNVSHASSEASVQSVQQQQTGVESLEIDQQASTVTIEASPTVRLCPPSGQNTVHNSSGTSGAGDSSLSSGPPSYSNNTVLHRNGNETAVKEVLSTQNDTDIITQSRVSTVASAPKVANNNGANSSQSRSETNTSSSNTNLSNNALETAVKEAWSPPVATEVFTSSHVRTVEVSAPEAPNKTATIEPGLVSSRHVSLSQDSDLVMDNGMSVVANQQQGLGHISAGHLRLDSLAESGYDTSLSESTAGDSIYTDSVGARTPGDGICIDSPGTASGADRNPSSTSMTEEVAANNNSSGTVGIQKPEEGPIRPESIALGLTQPMSSQAVSSELRPSLPNPLLPGVTPPGPSQPQTAQSGWSSLAYVGLRSIQEAFFNTSSYHEGS